VSGGRVPHCGAGEKLGIKTSRGTSRRISPNSCALARVRRRSAPAAHTRCS
jgi:hypothetical protein